MKGDLQRQVQNGVAQEYYDLGSYSRADVTTKNDDARKWFDRGLIWSYAFNHEEAVHCFERATSLDGNFAMAYWGLAYASGPNYNKPWEAYDGKELSYIAKRTHNAVEKARRCAATNASPVEKALCDALEFRYPSAKAPGDEDSSIWNRGYADAMQGVYQQFPHDMDVVVLYVDALMNLTPWSLWDLSTGEPAKGARTLEAKAILDKAMTQEGGLQHPGLLHLYIHLMEMSPIPEAALDAANRLRGLVPHAGHLNHMPTHIDVILGEYQLGIESNQQAIVADEVFLAREGPLNFYTLYRVHDYHFRIYCAMFAGQSKVALETVSHLESSLSEELLRIETPPMSDWLEGFYPMRVHILVRFGMWQDLIDLPLPQDPQLYSVTTAMYHYGKGVAYAALGRVPEAQREQALFLESVKSVAPTRMLFNNKCQDILSVAAPMLAGEIEYRRANYDEAFAHLRESMSRSFSLPYDEPWGWMQPPSHAKGALLTEQGRYEEALKLYAEDLGIRPILPRALRHPKNVWALHGYHECLVRLGRKEEAEAIKPQLDKAVQGADVPVTSSCFCRRTTSTCCGGGDGDGDDGA